MCSFTVHLCLSFQSYRRQAHYHFSHRQKMGEQLICKTNPTSDLVRKQLSQLKDQWQTLKQTAANQKRALGGAKSLQQFNKKVDKLEAWIKEKV